MCGWCSIKCVSISGKLFFCPFLFLKEMDNPFPLRAATNHSFFPMRPQELLDRPSTFFCLRWYVSPEACSAGTVRNRHSLIPTNYKAICRSTRRPSTLLSMPLRDCTPPQTKAQYRKLGIFEEPEIEPYPQPILRITQRLFRPRPRHFLTSPPQSLRSSSGRPSTFPPSPAPRPVLRPLLLHHKADLSLCLFGKGHKLSDSLDDGVNLYVVALHFPLQLLQFLREFLVPCERPPQLNKCSHHINAHLNRSAAVQYGRRHDGPMFCENERQFRLPPCRELDVAFCDFKRVNSSRVNLNTKSSGNRSMLRRTCSFKRLVVTA